MSDTTSDGAMSSVDRDFYSYQGNSDTVETVQKATFWSGNVMTAGGIGWAMKRSCNPTTVLKTGLKGTAAGYAGFFIGSTLAHELGTGAWLARHWLLDKSVFIPPPGRQPAVVGMKIAHDKSGWGSWAAIAAGVGGALLGAAAVGLFVVATGGAGAIALSAVMAASTSTTATLVGGIIGGLAATTVSEATSQAGAV